MAAKLKKRALAEYQSQVIEDGATEIKDQSSKTNKKLKLLMPPRYESVFLGSFNLPTLIVELK